MAKSLVAVLAACAGLVSAADITGTVIVKRELTRRNVTAAAPAYQRGVAVRLAGSKAEDPLDFERSHVAVYIERASPMASSPAGALDPPAGTGTQPVEIKQEDRRFAPDMVVVPVGSTVSFPNMDEIFHNVFSLSKARAFDLGNYPKGETRLVKFPAAGVVYVYCHLHPNMAASVVVSPTQWATRADPTGHFNLPEVPPGKYTVVAWHKAAGFFRQTVTVTGEDPPAISFLIPLPAEGKPKGKR